MAIVGFLGISFTARSLKSGTEKGIYKKIDESTNCIYIKIDELEHRKANRDYVDREIDKILKQNSEQITMHVSENNAQFSMILAYMESVDKKFDNLNQNMIELIKKGLK
jgi:hypothetical protein